MTILVFSEPQVKRQLGKRDAFNDLRKMVGGALKESNAHYAESSIDAPITLGISGGIWQGTGTFDTPTTGLKIWHDSGIGRIAGYQSGNLQWYAATNGVFFAGEGAVYLDVNGVTLTAGLLNVNSVKWKDSSGNIAGRIYTQSGSGQNNMALEVTGDSVDTVAKMTFLIRDVSLSPTTVFTLRGAGGNHEAALYPEAGTFAGLVIGANATPNALLDVRGAGIFTGNLSAQSFFFLPTKSTLTIAAGVITVTGSRHLVDTEGAAATDNLDTINGGQDGAILIISTVDSARDVVVRHNTGNLLLNGGADRTLTNVNKRMVLTYDSTSSFWVEWNQG